MKFLVAGIAGVISFHAARALLDHGDQIVDFDNLNGYRQGFAPPSLFISIFRGWMPSIAKLQ
jgi:nucleoside-diphosphate-sugar epimerase